jgi:hypothetical protein
MNRIVRVLGQLAILALYIFGTGNIWHTNLKSMDAYIIQASVIALIATTAL